MLTKFLKSAEWRLYVTEVNSGDATRGWSGGGATGRTTVTVGGVRRRRLQWLMSISLHCLLIFGVGCWATGEVGSCNCVPDGRGLPAVKRTQPSCKHFHLSAAGKAAGLTDGRTDGRGIYKPINSLDLILTDKYTSTTMQGLRLHLEGPSLVHYIIISCWLPVDFHKCSVKGPPSLLQVQELVATLSLVLLENLWIRCWWEVKLHKTYQVNTDSWILLHFYPSLFIFIVFLKSCCL